MPTRAVDALTRLANASSTQEATRALEAARNALGSEASSFAPLLETLALRAQELSRYRLIATRDDLTGVANRRMFRESLDRELARHRRKKGGFAVIMIDLDGLKGINDQLGHAAGDQAIIDVANSCIKAVRASDLVARLGGDEFAVLLPETTLRGAWAVARRIRAIVGEHVVDNKHLEVSLGVACVFDDTDTAEQLLERADAELYRDKRSRKKTASAAPAA